MEVITAQNVEVNAPMQQDAPPSAPPPPAGWTWPHEGERIEVEVEGSDEARHMLRTLHPGGQERKK